jgi:ATP-dependent Lhr-like helicase
LHVDYSERTVVVTPAPAGKKPNWESYVPQFLGYEICREMAAILSDDRPLPYLADRAALSLQEQRSERGNLLRSGGFAVEVIDGEEFLWTYAGGAVNETLKYGMSLLFGWTVRANNFRLRVSRPQEAGQMTLFQGLEKLADPGTWEDAEFQERLLNAMPEYRLSKFQQALPRRRSLEMVQAYLLDVPGALRHLNERLGRQDRLTAAAEA